MEVKEKGGKSSSGDGTGGGLSEKEVSENKVVLQGELGGVGEGVAEWR